MLTHDVARGARAQMPYGVGCLLAFHPAATSPQSLAALRRLMGSDRAQRSNREQVVTAATRHPQELPDLADRALVQALRVELRAHAEAAERGDPYVARVAGVVARARRLSPYSTDGWVVALRGTSHPDVVAAAVARGPMRAVVLDAILNDAFLPPASLYLAWVAVSHLVRAALVESHEVLARPGVGAAVLRLERAFPGTLGELLATASSIAPAAG